MSINSLSPVQFNIIKPNISRKPIGLNQCDITTFENPFINKKPLVERNIISDNENINQFFEKIAYSILENPKEAQYFADLMKCGAVALSSNAFNNLSDPKSSIGVKLNPQKTDLQNIAQLEQYLDKGLGIGINFCEFSNPCDLIKKINEYFKFREKDLKRPPAAIALLNITHPKIIDFITLKNKESYDDWCFNLSVIIDDEFLSKVDNNEDIELDDGTRLPARTIYKKLISSMRKKGEPGVIFSNDKNYICDCCATAPLKPEEGLVLGHINLAKFYNFQTRQIDSKAVSNLSNATKILAKALNKISPVSYIGILGYGELLQRINVPYGQKDALSILGFYLSTIQKQAVSNNVKLAIAPTSTTSRLLKTTPGLDYKDSKHSETLNYYSELTTLKAAQKYLDGNISKTICLDKNNTKEDINKIIRYCAKNGIRGISVFVK